MIARLPGWQKIKSVGVSFNFFSFLKFSGFISFFLFLSLISVPAFANGLSITNPELVDNVPASDTSDFEFDITWNNSWRDNENYDAVWVFVKYCTSGCTAVDGSAVWSHATLKTSGTNPSGVSRGSGTLIDVVVGQDKKGAFIQRTGGGIGTVTTTNISLVWDYATDGVSDATAVATTTYIKVFGIEMVYIPEGGFWLGDAADGTALTTVANFEYGGAATSLPGIVSSEGLLNFGTTATTFYYNTEQNANDGASGVIFSLPAVFPKGFQAFYMMKYEITEGQWIDFFNTLSPANAQTNRDITNNTNGGKNSDYATVANRNTIAWTAGGLATSAKPDRAMGYLGWPDLAAYLDWAAIRPMTELEFEKAARGPTYPVATEYAWGSTAATNCAAAGQGATLDGTETCSTGSSNITAANITFSGSSNAADNTTGPTRVGLYAKSTSVTRVDSGASYYGVMDLSGNVYEMVVTVGEVAGRTFAGTNGDGTLVTGSGSALYDGNATNDWPGISTTLSQGISVAAAASGAGVRGGAYSIALATPSELRVSNRANANIRPVGRMATRGGRGVRTAAS